MVILIIYSGGCLPKSGGVWGVSGGCRKITGYKCTVYIQNIFNLLICANTVIANTGSHPRVANPWVGTLWLAPLVGTFWLAPFGWHLLVGTFWLAPFGWHLLVLHFLVGTLGLPTLPKGANPRVGKSWRLRIPEI